MFDVGENDKNLDDRVLPPTMEIAGLAGDELVRIACMRHQPLVLCIILKDWVRKYRQKCTGKASASVTRGRFVAPMAETVRSLTAGVPEIDANAAEELHMPLSLDRPVESPFQNAASRQITAVWQLCTFRRRSRRFAGNFSVMTPVFIWPRGRREKIFMDTQDHFRAALELRFRLPGSGIHKVVGAGVFRDREPDPVETVSKSRSPVQMAGFRW